ncbi:MAG: hypothetical protein LUQ38_11745 [Methanotrichaceae archaeon]|nr:hypothetical protein [Methanotrichaceae archaeon]
MEHFSGICNYEPRTRRRARRTWIHGGEAALIHTSNPLSFISNQDLVFGIFVDNPRTLELETAAKEILSKLFDI